MIIIDTHTHAGRNWFEPVDMLIHQMNLNGVDKAILIQHGRPETGGYDQAYLFECVERFPGRFGVGVIVDLTRPDALETLEGYATQGALGVRLNPTQRSQGGDPLAIWRKADELGLVVSSMGGVEDTGSDEFSDLVRRFPDPPFILEHMAGGGEGAAFPGNGEGPQPPYTAFQKAMELACDAFGPRRMMWGSDYPPVSQREGYRNALHGLMDHPAFQSQDGREWIMGKTALSVLKFE